MPARIFVFGSYIADMMMRTPRLPRRGETIFAGPFQIGPGGKGSNQAVAARRAGADVLFATRVGDDELGRAARRMFEAEGIDARFAFVDADGVATGAALIMVEEGSAENMITVAIGPCARAENKCCAMSITVAGRSKSAPIWRNLSRRSMW